MAIPHNEVVAQWLFEKLEELKTAGGEAGVVPDVVRQLSLGMFSAPEDKLLALWQDDPDVIEEHPLGKADWLGNFLVYCFVRQSDNSTVAADTPLNTLRADVEKKLLSDRTCGGNAINLTINAPSQSPWGDGSLVIVVSFDVYYRTLEADPYTQG